MNYPAASSGVSKTTTGKILRPKGRGIHPDGINFLKAFFHFFSEQSLLGSDRVAFAPADSRGLAAKNQIQGCVSVTVIIQHTLSS